MSKRELFKIEGENVTRTRKHCPKCGPGVFLAEHKNRLSCGKCGYTEFKSAGGKEKSSPQEKPEEKAKPEEAKPKESKESEPEQKEEVKKEEPKKEYI